MKGLFMIYTLGIDIGSTTSKGLILKGGSEIVESVVITAGTGTKGPDQVIAQLYQKSGLTKSDIFQTLVTGYGRKTFPGADKQLSELTCHARGAVFLFPDVRTVIDIGGQDAKVMSLDEKGKMQNFIMNDKCAAGTGRFLDVMAAVLQLKTSALEYEAAKAVKPVKISSTCTVFAESEVISQLAMGVNTPDLVSGICQSVAIRVSSLAKRCGIRERVCMSGGVAQNGGVRKALETELGVEILYSQKAQLAGALGAALLAKEMF
jgi:predicted CoA-substrate-specific enzyme activase